jgi:hypothetical protein
MEIKKYIRLISRQILFQRLRTDNIRNIRDLISHLKAERKYISYPFNEYPPTIANYSFFRKSDLKWFDFYYSVCGKPDPDFISVPCYLFVENCLNDRLLINGIKEKNFYNKFMPGIPTPATILRRINGFYYDDQFKKIDRKNIMSFLNSCNKIILKPSVDTGGGRSILAFENQKGIFNNKGCNLNPEFLDKYGNNFIIQEFVNQHSFYSQFNPTSNNTVKIFTYRSINDDSVNLLHCVLWVGARGSYLDHDHWGGFGLSINEENKIDKYAIDVFGNKCESVNNIIISDLGNVPAMEKMKTLAKNIASNVYYARLLGIDFTVNNYGEPLLLEFNCYHNGIHQYQMHNGGLFKKFTNEILDYCQKSNTRYVVRI